MSEPSPIVDHRVTRRGVAAVFVREGRLLVIRRSAFVSAPGRYCFPGGGMEPGEDEKQALVREMREELSLDVVPRHRLFRSVTPWKIDLAWWLTDFPVDAVMRPEPSEVESVHWFDVPEILALDALLESNRLFLTAWREGVFEIEGLVRDG